MKKNLGLLVSLLFVGLNCIVAEDFSSLQNLNQHYSNESEYEMDMIRLIAITTAVTFLTTDMIVQDYEPGQTNTVPGEGIGEEDISALIQGFREQAILQIGSGDIPNTEDEEIDRGKLVEYINEGWLEIEFALRLSMMSLQYEPSSEKFSYLADTRLLIEAIGRYHNLDINNIVSTYYGQFGENSDLSEEQIQQLFPFSGVEDYLDQIGIFIQ